MKSWWRPEGPRVFYNKIEGYLEIEDLNPEVKLRWKVSRKDAFQIGWQLIWGALSAPGKWNE
jgi:hypothetical protein